MLTLGLEPHVWVCAVALAYLCFDHGVTSGLQYQEWKVVAGILYPGANFQEHSGHPPMPLQSSVASKTCHLHVNILNGQFMTRK